VVCVRKTLRLANLECMILDALDRITNASNVALALPNAKKRSTMKKNMLVSPVNIVHLLLKSISMGTMRRSALRSQEHANSAKRLSNSLIIMIIIIFVVVRHTNVTLARTLLS